MGIIRQNLTTSGFLILLIFPVFMCGMRHAYAADTDAHALVFGVWLGVLSGTCWVLASTATDLPLLSDPPHLSSLLPPVLGDGSVLWLPLAEKLLAMEIQQLLPFWAGMLLVTTAYPIGANGRDAGQAVRLKPPSVIHECDVNCNTLTLENGNYTVPPQSWEHPNGPVIWRVETFSRNVVILHRTFPVDQVFRGQISKSGDSLVNITVNRVPAALRITWGSALGTIPGSNAERDRASGSATNDPFSVPWTKDQIAHMTGQQQMDLFQSYMGPHTPEEQQQLEQIQEREDEAEEKDHARQEKREQACQQNRNSPACNTPDYN